MDMMVMDEGIKGGLLLDLRWAFIGYSGFWVKMKGGLLLDEGRATPEWGGGGGGGHVIMV